MVTGSDTTTPQFGITATALGDTTVRLEVRGEVDIATAGTFSAALQDLLNRSHLTDVVLDFAPLVFFDSTGIAALLAACSAARRRGISLTITNCQGIVQRAFDITGLSAQLTVGAAGDQQAGEPGHPTAAQRRATTCVVRRAAR